MVFVSVQNQILSAGAIVRKANKKQSTSKQFKVGVFVSFFCFFLNWFSVKRNCADIYKSAGEPTDGVYTIKPDELPAFDVFCDQTTDGGGWTVFQKRLNGSVDFYRYWNDYKCGFGDLNSEFWLGLDKIHRLTSYNNNTLHVDLEDFQGNTAYAKYNLFGVMSEKDKYKLILGSYSGRTVSFVNFRLRREELADNQCVSEL